MGTLTHEAPQQQPAPPQVEAVAAEGVAEEQAYGNAASQEQLAGVAPSPEAPLASPAPGDPPALGGQLVGEWSESLSAARLYARDPLRGGDGQPAGFATPGEARAFAQVKVMGARADGGLVAQHEGRFWAFSLTVESWLYDFTRENVEEGFDEVKVKGGHAVDCFLTQDGHVVTPTTRSQPYIVTKENEGVHWKSTGIPASGDYAGLAASARSGEGPMAGAGEGDCLALFQGMVKARAMALLAGNRAKLDALEARLGAAQGGGEDPIFGQLRLLGELDLKLAERAEGLRDQGSTLLLIAEAGLAHLPEGVASLDRGGSPEGEALLERAEEIEQERRQMRDAFPALGAVDTAGMAGKDDGALLEEMRPRFQAVREGITATEQAIHSGDLGVNELGPLVRQVGAELGVSEAGREGGEVMSAAVLDWLDDEGLTDALISFGSAGLSVALTVGALFASGGLAAVLGLLGAGSGLGGALYDLEKLGDGADAATAGAGGSKLVDADEGEARLRLFMAWANLTLAGLDLGLAGKALGATSKAATGGQRVATYAGAEVLARMGPDDLAKLDAARRLAARGEQAAAEAILATLQQKVGPEVLAQAAGFMSRAAATDRLLAAWPDLSGELVRALSAHAPRVLDEAVALGRPFVEELGRLTAASLGALDPATLGRLGESLGALALNRLGRELGAELLVELSAKLPAATLVRLAERGLDGATLRALVQRFGPEDLARMADELDGPALKQKALEVEAPKPQPKPNRDPGRDTVKNHDVEIEAPRNTFKGKTFEQINKEFQDKGFIAKGDPANGKGQYIDPERGTKYFLDKGGQYKDGFEPPHVDVWLDGGKTKEKWLLNGDIWVPNK